MKLQDFDIDLNKHSEDHFQLSFELKDEFFALKDNSLYDKCRIDVNLSVDRIDSTINLRFVMKGLVYSECERCLKPIELGADSDFIVIFKLTSDPDLIQEDSYIAENHPVLSVYDSLYEQICITLPGRLICDNALGQNKCEIPENKDSEQKTDPRWDKLKNLIK